MNREQNISLVRKMTNAFLKNKQLGALIFFGILFSGLLGFFGMPKQYNPEITAPAFLVTTEYPGATAQEVHAWITKPMEDRIREISTLDTVSSFSIDGGVSRVLVKFNVGENEEDAKITLMQKFQSTLFLKPEGANDPLIQALSPDDIPIVTVAISSESLSLESLRKLGYDFQEKLRGIKGVSGIDIYGGRSAVYEIIVDAKKLSSLGIGMQDVYSAVSSHNRYMYVGDMVSENTSLPLKITSFFQSKEDIEKISITRKDQPSVYLGEIADVRWGQTEITTHTSFFGSETSLQENAVYIAFSKKKGTNAITVSQEINDKVEDLKKEGFFSEHTSVSVVSDDGKIAQEEIYGLTGNLFTSIGIVSIILFLFLGWRSALVVFTAIPLSLALVFLVGYLFDQTINRITLFALILSLGLLVDSAIVVIENIVQKTKQKKSLNDEDIVDAVDEVGVGLFLSTVTTILAFVPMAFVTGMMGPYMGPIPFFVPVALIASLFVAYTLTPLVFRWVISRFGKDSYKKPIASGLLLFAQKVYAKNMRKILTSSSLRKKLLLGSFFALIGSFLLIAFALVPFRMLPKADKEQFFVYVDMPENTSFIRTEKVSNDIASLIAKHAEVKSVQIFVGTPAVKDFNGLFQGSFLRAQEYQATLRVSLSHPDTRKPFSQDIVSEIRKEILSQKEHIGIEATLRFIEDPPGPPVESTFRLGVVSQNEYLRDEVTREVASFVTTLEGVADIDTTLSRQTKSLSFHIERSRVKDLGLSIEQVQKEMQFIFSDVQIGSFRALEKGEKLFSEQEHIVVKTKKEDRDEVKDLDALFIQNSFGEMIPLGSVLIPDAIERPSILLSEDYAPIEYISGEMENRGVIYAMIDTMRYLFSQYRGEEGRLVFEKGSLLGVSYKDKETSERVDIRFLGEWELTLEVFRDLGIAFGIALFAIFFVLALQFRSFFIPIFIMGTIPFALIGVLPGFALLYFWKGTFFNATSMIGVIALAGIVVNNAIIFMEYFNQERTKNSDIAEALIQTGKSRLAPILLTSLTTILGSLTIISDPVWEGLAWAIIWGLSLSVILTLVLFPIFLFHRYGKKTLSS